MIKLNNEQLVANTGGDAIHGACAGFGAAAATVYLGAALNWWNPVGWVGGTVAAVATVGCAGYFVYTNS